MHPPAFSALPALGGWQKVEHPRNKIERARIKSGEDTTSWWAIYRDLSVALLQEASFGAQGGTRGILFLAIVSSSSAAVPVVSACCVAPSCSDRTNAVALKSTKRSETKATRTCTTLLHNCTSTGCLPPDLDAGRSKKREESGARCGTIPSKAEQQTSPYILPQSVTVGR